MLSPALQAGLDEVAGGEREGLGGPVILGFDGTGLLENVSNEHAKKWAGGWQLTPLFISVPAKPVKALLRSEAATSRALPR